MKFEYYYSLLDQVSKGNRFGMARTRFFTKFRHFFGNLNVNKLILAFVFINCRCINKRHRNMNAHFSTLLVNRKMIVRLSFVIMYSNQYKVTNCFAKYSFRGQNKACASWNINANIYQMFYVFASVLHHRQFTHMFELVFILFIKAFQESLSVIAYHLYFDKWPIFYQQKTIFLECTNGINTTTC